MFTRLGQVEAKMGKSRLDFFQTHPSSESRVKVRRLLYHRSFLLLTCLIPAQLLREALPQGYAILAANPDCELVRNEMQAFRESARPIKIDRSGINLQWGSLQHSSRVLSLCLMISRIEIWRGGEGGIFARTSKWSGLLYTQFGNEGNTSILYVILIREDN